MTAMPTIYEELGLIPIINATGHQTVLGGSTPSPSVKAAMERSERYYVDMASLLQKAGEIIAELIGAEAAYVTSGAAGALALGTAACITGQDLERIARLPDTTGMKNQVIIQAKQRYKYEHATTIVGTTLVEAGDANGTTAAQLAAVCGPSTAAVLYPAHLESTPGTLSLVQVLDIAHHHGVPVLVDAASQVYPLDVFRSFTKLGCDLVCFGAKYLGAAQSSGILCGKKDLVAAAVLQGFIGFEQSAANKAFGRPLKLDRQEIVGVVTALREWMTMDHTLRIAELERKLTVIGHPLEGLPGVKLHYLQGGGAGPRVLRVTIEPGVAKKSAAEVIAGLRQGNPAISVGAEPHALLINPSTIQRGDEEIVAQRLQTLLA